MKAPQKKKKKVISYDKKDYVYVHGCVRCVDTDCVWGGHESVCSRGWVSKGVRGVQPAEH